jgi:nucleoid DNA-binding protein
MPKSKSWMDAIVERISARTGFHKSQIRTICVAFLEEFRQELLNRGQICILKFMTIYVHIKPAYHRWTIAQGDTVVPDTAEFRARQPKSFKADLRKIMDDPTDPRVAVWMDLRKADIARVEKKRARKANLQAPTERLAEWREERLTKDTELAKAAITAQMEALGSLSPEDRERVSNAAAEAFRAMMKEDQDARAEAKLAKRQAWKDKIAQYKAFRIQERERKRLEMLEQATPQVTPQE